MKCEDSFTKSWLNLFTSFFLKFSDDIDFNREQTKCAMLNQSYWTFIILHNIHGHAMHILKQPQIRWHIISDADYER